MGRLPMLCSLTWLSSPPDTAWRAFILASMSDMSTFFMLPCCCEVGTRFGQVVGDMQCPEGCVPCVLVLRAVRAVACFSHKDSPGSLYPASHRGPGPQTGKARKSVQLSRGKVGVGVNGDRWRLKVGGPW